MWTFLSLRGAVSCTERGDKIKRPSVTFEFRSRMRSIVRQPWLPEKWDREADVVVVGFGGAGAAAAITAHDLGAKVLMLEKAPEGEEGGNTRIAGQGYLQIYDVDKAVTYLDALSGPHPVPPQMVRTWAEEVRGNNDWEIGRAHV